MPQFSKGEATDFFEAQAPSIVRDVPCQHALSSGHVPSRKYIEGIFHSAFRHEGFAETIRSLRLRSLPSDNKRLQFLRLVMDCPVLS
jgi:hypothetical protein